MTQTKHQAIRDPKIISVHNSNRKTNDLIYIYTNGKIPNNIYEHQRTISNCWTTGPWINQDRCINMQGVWIVLYRQHIAVKGISFRSSLKFISNNEHILIGNLSKGEGNQCYVLHGNTRWTLFILFIGALQVSCWNKYSHRYLQSVLGCFYV